MPVRTTGHRRLLRRTSSARWAAAAAAVLVLAALAFGAFGAGADEPAPGTGTAASEAGLEATPTVPGGVTAGPQLAPPAPTALGATALDPTTGAPLASPPKQPIALTFDDGPWPGQTEQVLAVLAERKAVATFFMLGLRVEKAPDLARAVAAGGHDLGNHSWSHREFGSLPLDELDWEITATNRYIGEITGVTPRYIRTPGGQITPTILDAIARAGLNSALWTIDPKDWQKGATAESITANVLGQARPGGIIVMHDGGSNRAATIAALPGIIDGLRAAGYELVTLDKLPAVKGTW